MGNGRIWRPVSCREEKLKLFIHGLDSSSRGTKATWFRSHFPELLLPDFRGDFKTRLAQLEGLLAGRKGSLIVGSSYGGLMAAVFAVEHEPLVEKLILLAPALNFREFHPWQGRRIKTPTWLYIGRTDMVTPLAAVEPVARKTFARLHFHPVDDDHLLRKTFESIDWRAHLG